MSLELWELWAVIVTALITGPVSALATYLLTRPKTRADITDIQIHSARELMAEYKEQADRLQVRVQKLEAESVVQATAIENLNAQVLKYRLALVITVMQLRIAGFEPMIDPANIDTMSVDELKLVAEGASNVEARRRGAEREE